MEESFCTVSHLKYPIGIISMLAAVLGAVTNFLGVRSKEQVDTISNSSS